MAFNESNFFFLKVSLAIRKYLTKAFRQAAPCMTCLCQEQGGHLTESEDKICNQLYECITDF